MPELISQQKALDIARLAAWQLYEARFLQMLHEAGCSQREAHLCMSWRNWST